MYQPFISIIIPVYNGSNFLAEAIDSALAQTYRNIEIIVVNDGSDDELATEKIALSYGNRIRYYKKENGGVSSALNFGIRNMRGEWFSWLSHDDLYLPEKIESQIEILNKKNLTHNDKTIIYANGYLINKDGKAILSRQIAFKEFYDGLSMFDYTLKKGYTLNGLALLIPKRAFEDCGFFDESLYYIQDRKMWQLLMLNNYNFICLDKKIIKSRVHPNQQTITIRDRFYIDNNNYSNELIDLLFKDLNKYYRQVLSLYYWSIYFNYKKISNRIKKLLKENGKYNFAIFIISKYKRANGFFYVMTKSLYNKYKNKIRGKK